jgi:hypothetical protein
MGINIMPNKLHLLSEANKSAGIKVFYKNSNDSVIRWGYDLEGKLRGIQIGEEKAPCYCIVHQGWKIENEPGFEIDYDLTSLNRKALDLGINTWYKYKNNTTSNIRYGRAPNGAIWCVHLFSPDAPRRTDVEEKWKLESSQYYEIDTNLSIDVKIVSGGIKYQTKAQMESPARRENEYYCIENGIVHYCYNICSRKYNEKSIDYGDDIQKFIRQIQSGKIKAVGLILPQELVVEKNQQEIITLIGEIEQSLKRIKEIYHVS